MANTITSIAPAVGPSGGGTAVTITGTGFATGNTVKFNGSLATSVVVVDSTKITCVTPASDDALSVAVKIADTSHPDAFIYYDIARYRQKSSNNRDWSAEMEVVTAWDGYETVRDALLQQNDPNEISLYPMSIDVGKLQDDNGQDYAQLSIQYGSQQQWEAYQLNKAFKIRYEYGWESFTVSGDAYYQDESEYVKIDNRNVLPVQTLLVTTAVLYGTRSSLTYDTYSAYADKVNSDSFLGAAAGYAYFGGASGTPRQLKNGTIVYDVEVRVKFRSQPWNNAWIEEKAGWFPIKFGAGKTPIYGSTSFASLLTAPS